MKQTEAQQVGDILRAMIESGGNEGAFDRQKASYLWSYVAGPLVNKATIKRFVDGDVMHVYIESGPLKNELSFIKSILIEKLNEAVGKKIIKDLIIH